MTAPACPRSRRVGVGPLHATIRALGGLALIVHGFMVVESLPLSFVELAVGLTLLGTAITRSCPFCRAVRRLLRWEQDPEG